MKANKAATVPVVKGGAQKPASAAGRPQYTQASANTNVGKKRK